MGIGGVKGGHHMKVRKALDLVAFLTGLLNSRLRVISMENPKDTINWYSCFSFLLDSFLTLSKGVETPPQCLRYVSIRCYISNY
jgi:hypothetical protein